MQDPMQNLCQRPRAAPARTLTPYSSANYGESRPAVVRPKTVAFATFTVPFWQDTGLGIAYSCHRKIGRLQTVHARSNGLSVGTRLVSLG